MKDFFDGWQIKGAISSVLLGLIVMPILGILIEVLDRPTTLPLWGFLSVVFLLIGVFLAVSKVSISKLKESLDRTSESLKIIEADNENLKEDAKAQGEQISMLTSLKFANGLYYKSTDTDLKQPFCRICWEINKQLTTIINIYETRNGYKHYYCDYCGQSYQLTNAPQDDEYPF